MRVDASACEALTAAVESSYDVTGPVSCRFLSHGFNDHFRVATGDGELHLRVYLDGKYYIDGDDDLRFELGLVAGLAAHGVPVAAPVAAADGGYLSVADLPVGQRRFALFEVAAGGPLQDATPEQASAFGVAIARIHTVADRLEIPGRRYHLDERYLIDEPLAHLGGLAGAADAVAALTVIGTRVKDRLARLTRSRPLYGLIHADPHNRNVHFADDGSFRIFDFDHCAFGWRAYDLATVRMVLPDETWPAFLTGYGSVRTVEDVELEHQQVFVAARAIWDVGDVLAMRTAWGTDDVSAGIAQRLPRMVEQLETLDL